MINAFAVLGKILMLSLGFTLIQWTGMLMLSSQNREPAQNFIRMFSGWFLIATTAHFFL